MRQFFPTKEAAIDYLIDCGFHLTPAGEWNRICRFARARQTKRGWVIDISTRQPY
jgi:hypothetical protein